MRLVKYPWNKCSSLEGECILTAVDNLVSYINTLTPEQIEKAITQLPQLLSAIAEQVQPAPQKEIPQTQ